MAEDPYGWREFVGFGVKRGELRTDLDVDMIGSILEWTMDRFQDALLTEELDPGLFRKTGSIPEKKEARIEQFVELLRRAIGSEKVQTDGEESMNGMNGGSGTSVEHIVGSYDAAAPLTEASTIPAPWYVDARIADLEQQTVFSRTWQAMGRVDQVAKPGQFVTASVAGEPLVAVGEEMTASSVPFITCAAITRRPW